MPASLPLVAVPLGAFSAVLLAAYALNTVLSPAEEPAEGPRPAVHPDSSEAAALRWLGGPAMPEDPLEQAEDRKKLAQAAFTGGSALASWYALRTALALGLPALVGLIMWDRLSIGVGSVMLTAAVLGYYGPSWAMGLLRHARQGRLQRAVPNLLDMLVSCLEAGLGTDAAFRYVSREVRVASAELADELDFANAEMSAGMSRQEALRRLDERTGVEEISGLVGVLGQAERFGAGVATSLRAHAQLARRRRALRAERRAAQASPLLTIVMIVCILPMLFVVLLGPTLIQVVERFLPTVSGAT